MKRWIAALVLLALFSTVAACAESFPADTVMSACEGWAVATENTEIHRTPDYTAEVVLEVAEGTELEYDGFTKYDNAHEPWYSVSWRDVTGWIPGSDAELKWSTLY